MIFIIGTVFIVLIDQASKLFIRQTMDIGNSIPIIKGILHITYIENMHTAFGVFKYHSIFFIIAILIILFSAFFVQKRIIFKENQKIYISLLLILGGGIGNLTDRIIYQGKVIDFIDFRIWPIFNIADIAIVIGTFMLLVYFLFYSKKEEKKG